MQYCGDGGTCEKASEFTHRCSCRDGYANLLNDTSYPCYQQCTQPPTISSPSETRASDLQLQSEATSESTDDAGSPAPGVSIGAAAGSLGSDCKGLGIDVINGSTPSSSPPAPFSFTVKKSGAGRPAAAPAHTLLGLPLLLTFYGLQ
jgi:hypothetical protein